MKRMPGLSIRARITLGSLVIAGVLFSTAAFFFRMEVQSILAASTATLLRNDAAPVVTEIERNPTEPIDKPGEGQLLAVFDPAHTIRMTTLPRSLAKQTPELVKLGAEPQSVYVGRFTYLVSTMTVSTPSGNWTIVAARNQEALDLLLDELTRVLVIGAVVLVAGFAVASWLLTGAALRPVSRLREEAESLSAAGSSAQLPVPAGNDEVSRLAVTLNAFIERLRSSIDREKQVVSDASHELRTPLAVLQAQLELAHLNAGDASALERDIDDASVTAERLSRLATNLLELSKLESEQTPPECDWHGLVAEVTASVDRARIARGGRQIEVVYDIRADDSDARYRLSRTNAGQMVDNLVSNAVAAIGDSGTVRVTLDRTDETMVITVDDTGPGMPESYIPVAFDRFSRPEQSRANGSSGSGLGLAIVFTIVERAGGAITLRNTADGFEASVRLPAEKARSTRNL
jgi:two-component system OmpR family sensor kinase